MLEKDEMVNCHELHPMLPEIRMFLNNMQARILTKTFNQGEEVKLEIMKALYYQLNDIPRKIEKGNEAYLKLKEKDKKS